MSLLIASSYQLDNVMGMQKRLFFIYFPINSFSDAVLWHRLDFCKIFITWSLSFSSFDIWLDSFEQRNHCRNAFSFAILSESSCLQFKRYSCVRSWCFWMVDQLLTLQDIVSCYCNKKKSRNKCWRRWQSEAVIKWEYTKWKYWPLLR